MTIEGLGKQFQDARLARGLTLDEAARLTKIRPSRLAEIEADDFSNFPSLAYAKGFLQIYGKFLDVDVSAYLEAFETSEQVTIDGYSYLQEAEPAPQPQRTRAPAVQRTKSDRPSLLPLIIGVVLLGGGLFIGKLFLDISRLTPRDAKTAASSPSPSISPAGPQIAVASAPAPPPPVAAPPAQTPAAAPPVVAEVPPSPTPAAMAAPTEPQVRRAEPVRAEELAAASPPPQSAASATASPVATPPGGINRVDIRPLRKTYVEVAVDGETAPRGYWISPAEGTIAFAGKRVSIRVLDPSAVQIRKNGKLVSGGQNVTIR